MATLTIRHLTRLFLDAVNFSVAGGECVALTGASGSGKTVLLRAIADLDPRQGEVSLDERSRTTWSGPEWRRQVAYVPSEPGWWSERIGDHFQSSANAERLIAGFGLGPEALQWSVSRASTGERQRLALARALERKPQVLLLDEPTANLDPDNRVLVEGVLSEHIATGVAVLLATHDLALAARLGTRRLGLGDGRLQEESGA